eukprot:CAMPEP_0197038068 /NCGR_PEP_ID=MMETSP1384-20130603/15105_1 /TAXON_ID=29189 /ORGANISM="Ammonia sp." /LENGTH=530 /DNA_ID=CAMNT_0042468461 /DNA_START=46 /DNA_END=1638 /DNA_ORIENTATION=-
MSSSNSSEEILAKHCDYTVHCDEQCMHILKPYIDNIERALQWQHAGNKLYHEIPVVIRSICSAYYCQHLDYRLAFKHLFHTNEYAEYGNFLSQHHGSDEQAYERCKLGYKSCPSIQRVIFVLSNFQSYLERNLWSKEPLSPYVTYAYYTLQQLSVDLAHINEIHPENFIKFYIRNNVIEFKSWHHFDGCIDHEQPLPNNEHDDEEEESLKQNLLNIHHEFIHHVQSGQQFQVAVSYIIAKNTDETIFDLLGVLRSISKKLFKNEERYRTLDTTNPRVIERLLGFDGVFEFLSVLGFASNALGNKLVCEHQPSMEVIRNAISIIDTLAPERHAVDTTAVMNAAAVTAPVVQPSSDRFAMIRKFRFNVSQINLPRISNAFKHIHIQRTNNQEAADEKKASEEPEEEQRQRRGSASFMSHVVNTMKSIHPLQKFGLHATNGQTPESSNSSNGSREMFGSIEPTTSETEQIDVDTELAKTAEAEAEADDYEDDAEPPPGLQKQSTALLRWFGDKLSKIKENNHNEEEENSVLDQ